LSGAWPHENLLGLIDEIEAFRAKYGNLPWTPTETPEEASSRFPEYNKSEKHSPRAKQLRELYSEQ
jgi:hypothetical protein